MRQRSPLGPWSVQQPLSPPAGAACRSRSAVASATIASRSAAPSAFQPGQSIAYISWRTYQPSRVTGAALTRRTIARARGHLKGASQDPASALEGGHALGAPGSARGGGGRAPPARLRLPRGPAHLPPLGRDHGVRGQDGRERLRPRVPLARCVPAHRPPAHVAPLRRGIHRRRGRHRGGHLRRHARGERDRAAARAAREPARGAGRTAPRMTAPAVRVVGGGPAGSTVAWRLARAGARVTVLDAARFPRVKLCAGWVTHAALAALELDPSAYPHTIQPFSAVSVAVGDVEHETHWERTASYGIVRAEFDTFLLRRAAAAGARVHEGARVREVCEVPGGARVASDAGTFTAGVVVGAGGHGCPVARALGRTRGEEEVVVTQESETRVGAERLRALTPRHGWPELIAEPDFRGYGWYFTKGDFLNIGVGALGGEPVRRRLERLLARLAASGRLPDDLALTPFRGHAYAIRRGQPRRPGGGRLPLVGDAAGPPRGVSGEGIGPPPRRARPPPGARPARRAGPPPPR